MKHRFIRLLLLPILIPIFFFGWLLTFTAEAKLQKKNRIVALDSGPCFHTFSSLEPESSTPLTEAE